MNAIKTTVETPLGTGESRMVQPARRGSYWIVFCLLALATGLLFYTAPRSGDFWWSDAPRHSMDGVFYYDLLHDAPRGDFKQYAVDYYLRYPALTIVFYPPLFALSEAVFFGVFGVSHSTAQLTVAFFYLLALLGVYTLCKRWLNTVGAFGVALLFGSLPEISLWGRQVMLELPVIAFLVWCANAVLTYVQTGRARFLYLASLFALCALYTKQTAASVLAAFAVFLFWQKGRLLLRDRHFWFNVGLFAVGLIPLAYISLKFGQLNVSQVAGGTWNTVPVMSWSGIFYYAAQLPQQIGWAVVVLAGLYWVLRFVRGTRYPGANFMLLWFATGYAFFSMVALKEPRHTTLILLPMAFFAVVALTEILPARIAGPAIMALSLSSFAIAMRTPVPYVSGYRQAAEYLAENAQPGSVILFSGYRDGPFVFDIRAQRAHRDFSVLRSDKLFLRVASRRDFGVEDLKITGPQMLEMLNRYGVAYVVSQPNFWDDLDSLQQLQSLLHGSQFKLVATIPVFSNVSVPEQRLEIYRNLGSVNPHPERIQLDVPLAGMVIEGAVGGKTQH